MTKVDNLAGLVERLTEEGMRLSGRSIDHGCVDSGIAANLCDEAIAYIATLTQELAEARAKLSMVDGTLTLERGFGIDTHETMLRLSKKINEENFALKVENARLRASLEPFVKHINDMKFDLDFNGNETSDDQTVGWVYLTNGDFRRARTALSSSASPAAPAMASQHSQADENVGGKS